MKESIRQLREICQAPRRPFDTWHGLHIARPISIYISVIFLRLKFSANSATTVFLFTGIVGSAVFLLGSYQAFFVAALLFQLWYILDHVDGEIARYNNQSSYTGIYFDEVSHYIVHPLLFFCLGLGLFFRRGNLFWVILGFINAFSILLLDVVIDIYRLISLERAKKIADAPWSVEKPANFMRRAFSFLHKLCTFPIIIDVLFIFTLIDVLFKKDTTVLFLWFYAVCLSIVWLAKLAYFVLTRKMDR